MVRPVRMPTGESEGQSLREKISAGEFQLVDG